MSALLGTILGLIGGAWHLTVTAWRARALTTGRVRLTIVSGPAGLLGPLAALTAALTVCPSGLWAFPLGLLTARALLVSPLCRRLEGPWTP